jgi:hypothetical protein
MIARASLACCALLVLLAGGAFASGRVAVVRHWSLYAATGPQNPYHLFLEPFPDARSCNVYGKQILRVGGRARCTSKLVLSFDRARESALFWEFLSVANPWARICGRRSTT